MNEPEDSKLTRAFETLQRFLEEDAWHPVQVPDQPIFRVIYAGKNGQQHGYAHIHELEQFVFYAVLTVKAPEAARGAVAEFLTRANYGLRIGNFEMDYHDGEVRYKSSLDFEDDELTPQLIRNAIYPAVQTMDLYMPGIMQVMYGSATPEEAITAIEDA